MGEAVSDVSRMHHVVSDDGDAGDHGGGKIDAHANSFSLSLSLSFAQSQHTVTRTHSPVKSVFLFFLFPETGLYFSSLFPILVPLLHFFSIPIFLDTEISNFSMRCAL